MTSKFFNIVVGAFCALASEKSSTASEKIIVVATLLIVSAIVFVAVYFVYLRLQIWKENKRESQKERKNSNKSALRNLEFWCGRLNLWMKKFTDGSDTDVDRDADKSAMSEIIKGVEVHFPKKLRKETDALAHAHAHCRECLSRFEAEFGAGQSFSQGEWDDFNRDVLSPAFGDLLAAYIAFRRAVAKLKAKL